MLIDVVVDVVVVDDDDDDGDGDDSDDTLILFSPAFWVCFSEAFLDDHRRSEFRLKSTSQT